MYIEILLYYHKLYCVSALSIHIESTNYLMIHARGFHVVASSQAFSCSAIFTFEVKETSLSLMVKWTRKQSGLGVRLINETN